MTQTRMPLLRGRTLPAALALLFAATLSLGFALAPQSTDRQGDHRSKSFFKVEIEGITQGPFLSVSGLEARTAVVEFRDGADLFVRRRPGTTSYANIVLRRGYTGLDELWQWYRQTANGKAARKSGSIILLDTTGQELERYKFFEGWPVRYRNYELDTHDQGTVVEEIEIAIENLERG